MLNAEVQSIQRQGHQAVPFFASALLLLAGPRPIRSAGLAGNCEPLTAQKFIGHAADGIAMTSLTAFLSCKFWMARGWAGLPI